MKYFAAYHQIDNNMYFALKNGAVNGENIRLRVKKKKQNLESFNRNFSLMYNRWYKSF